MLPGPSDAIRRGQHEEHDRHQPGVAAAHAHRGVRDAVERAVDLRLREEQRDADQREEQLDREAGSHVVEPACRRDTRRRSTRAPATTTPTFSCVKQLTIIATTSAASESQARFIADHRAWRLQGEGGAARPGAPRDAGEVGDLMAARRAGGDHHRPGPSAARARQEELALADRARDLVVLARVAERAGHAAAAGVEIDDRRRRECRDSSSAFAGARSPIDF